MINFAKIYNRAQRDIERLKKKSLPQFPLRIIFGDRSSSNRVTAGDNMPYMLHLLQTGFARKLNFIYIDPPFSTGLSYNARVTVGGELIRSRAYGDKWDDGIEGFLAMLCPRLLLMKELLAETGIIAVHLDRHAVHYVKVLMDEIFGEDHFVNELIWTYKSGGASGKSFAHKHDTILVYSNTDKYTFHPQKEKSYNRQLRPYNFKGVEEFEDEIGWYTLVNRKDVISVDMVGRSSSERTGYATQKPEALLNILLESFTNPGDLCADFFAGSGTLAVCAAALDRRFLCCDKGFQAFEILTKRLAERGIPFACQMQDGCHGPKASVDVSFSDDEAPEQIRIHSYTLSRKGLHLTPQEAKIFDRVRRKDKTALLDFWAVDPDYDGQVFRAAVVFTRCSGKEKEIVLEAAGIKPGIGLTEADSAARTAPSETATNDSSAPKEAKNRLAILAMDAFGGIAIKVVESGS